MRVEFSNSFTKDLKRIKDKSLFIRVKDAILNVEKANSLAGIANIKKLKGGGNYFRLKLGGYRIGIELDNDTVIFIRFMNRKDIYKYFP